MNSAEKITYLELLAWIAYETATDELAQRINDLLWAARTVYYTT